MISREKQLDLDEVTAGMILSSDVLDGHGGILLPAQTELTEAMLKSLARRGIDIIRVINDDISEEELLAERTRVQQRLTVLFRKCEAEPACQALRRHVLRYRLGE